MKNRKGFTLVELLAVVLLVALLLLIAVPAIMRYMKQGTRSYYHSIENEMKVSGMDYMESYRTLLPRQINHVTVVELDELVDNKYIDPVLDEKGNTCTGQVAIKKLRNNNYEYHSCLVCGEYYSSEEQECDFDESKNEYADSALYTIEVPVGPFKVGQLETFVAPYAKVYYNGQLIKDDLEGKPKKLDTTKIGTYEIKYFYHGATGSIFVEVEDNTEPSKAQVVLKYDNKNGKNYKGNWYSGNVYAEYKATDYTKKGIEGSGIAYYETKTENGEWTRIDSDSETITTEGNYTRYVRAVDNGGMVGPEMSYNIKIDKTPPTHCSWEGESTVWQPNLNLPAAQQVTSRTIKATCHDAISGCTNATKTHSWTETASNKTKTLTYNMYDLAGNKTVCTKNANIYLDKTKPNISAKSNPLTLGNGAYTFTSNLNYNDDLSGVGLSGIASVTCNPASSRGSGTYNVTCTVVDNMGLSNTVTFGVQHNYPGSPSTVTDAGYCGSYYCGTERCNCEYCCDTPCLSHGYKWCCNGSIGCGDLCEYCESFGEPNCGYGCNCQTCPQYCPNSCTIYTCNRGGHHSNGSTVSTEQMCYY